MKVWKDKEGKPVEGKEFIKRWKEGMKQATPLQQIKVTLFGYCIVLVGVIWGIIISFLVKQYWLTTVLLGSIVISSVQFLGTYQKYSLLKTIEKEVTHE